MNLSMREGRVLRVAVSACLALLAFDASAAISGIVFRDFNSNGLRDTGGTAAAVDVGIGGVGVRAYDAAGACGTPTTTSTVPASIGTYTLVTTGCSGAAPLRIEFSGFPAGLQPSFHGRPSSGATTAAQAGTSVQFAADGTVNLELALNEPIQFCQNDPVVAVAEQAFGDAQSAANAAIDSVVRFPYSVAGSTGTPQPVGPVGLADVPLVGTVYGLAFDRRNDHLYIGAYHKRHAGFGPSGTGAIYRTTAVSSGAPSAAALYADLNAIYGAGTAGTDTVRGNYEGGAGGDQTWDEVGKSALGDLELSPDGTRLYVVNLADRQLYSLPTSGPVNAGTITRTPIPGPCSNNASDARPFGLEFHNGLLYVGGVCSAQSTQLATDLSAYFYTYNPTAGTFSGTPVFQFALNYPRAAGNQDAIADPTGDDIWRAWSTAQGVPAGSGGGIWAQPMLADVAFDGADIVIGLRDRHGDQTGTGGLGTIRGYSGGELLRACSNGAGGWNLEQNGSCGGITGAVGTATNQARGPASVGNTRGGEYYALEHYSNTTPPFFINDTPPDYNGRHDETAQGSVAQTPGYPNVMATVMDPFSFDSGGVRWFWNTDPNNVALTRGYRVFITGSTGFAKANGLGDLQALCRAAPVEVGNYLWNDLDHDGVMDPGEPPIAGVILNIYTPAGVLLGTATTGANGEFYFIFTQGATDPSTADNSIILPNPYNSSFVIVVAPSNFLSGGALANLTPTTPNNAGPGDGLLRDSNGVPVVVPGLGTVTGVPITLNGPGSNDHTIDLGFGALDYGDLPDTAVGTGTGNYNTTVADNGAAHGVTAGLFLGATVDAEGDGQPNAAASGDDINGAPDDEDGITVADLSLRVGRVATIRANATNTGATAAQLCGFVDFNGDGDFLDAGETAPAQAVPAGSNNVQFTLNFGTVAAGAASSTYARFRLSTTGGACTPVGFQTDGEVEDYPVGIAALDFGDLPDTGAGTGPANYSTLEADNGPSHGIIAGLFMGTRVDAEGDGQPGVAATGDDLAGGPDDEDGVNVADLVMTAGTTANVRVTVTNTSGSAARLCGFIDFNGDGTLETNAFTTIPNGSVGIVSTLNFGTVPLGAVPATYARFRLDTGVGACSATGAAANGEVEDYTAGVIQLDYGDAPNSYGTLLAQNGPRHPIVATLRLGLNEDAEGDGQPNVTASGDDSNGVPDDEDGITVADLSLTAGAGATVRANATNNFGSPAQLCGFIDFNGDGDFADVGEAATPVSVPTGSTNAPFVLNFGTVPLNAAPASYARFRLSTDLGACTPLGLAPNGEVEDYPVTVAALDWGDLPDSGVGTGAGNYATLLADNGPRHAIVAGLFLGAAEDAEGDGQPSPAANGDDANGTPDDEDGVNTADLSLIAGQPAAIRVTATDTLGSAATLCGFIDFNADGDFADAGEAATSVNVPAGSNAVEFTLNFSVPLGAAPATFARFRISTDAVPCSPVGAAGDGEVEDYPVGIGQLDLGDLPDLGNGSGIGDYATRIADNGPRHPIVAGLRLGAAIDGEADGQPNTAANGDDLAGAPDDEDGITVADLNLIGGATATVRATATNTLAGAAQLCGFIDFNGDGDFADAGETAPAVSVPSGSNNAPFTLNFGTVPLTAVAQTYARFRLSTAAGACSPNGLAPDGEVEDYAASIAQLDWGDLPDIGAGSGAGNYATTLADDGARHVIDPELYLGDELDAEADGQPNTAADGDDTNGTPDDEDGVVVGDLNLTAGTTATIRVNTTNTLGQAAQLCGFVDFNGDGDFADAGETAPAVAVPPGSNVQYTLNFGTVPATAVASTYARFRLSTAVGPCTPTGLASDGEVEDYRVVIGLLDLGDLPDTGAGTGAGNYATLLADDGPRHPIVAGLQLGAAIDADSDGQPNVGADGDDLNGTPDDEDGVTVGDLLLTAGTPANVRVNATNTLAGGARLCGFIDFNGDGDFADAGEAAPPVTVPAGSSNVQFTLNFGAVPVTTPATTYARFRISSGTLPCTSTGAASDGEVEDYAVAVGQLDWGDLPDTGAGSGAGNYATLDADNGPRHAIVAGLRLGANEDAEGDGQPNASASGDDVNGTPDDEDGINTADLTLTAGTAATVRATATNTTGTAAQLCGFIDFNADGDFADAGETAPAVSVPNGSSNAPFTLNFGTVPLTVAANTYARFRLSTDAGACSPVGLASNGEVEDYPVSAGALDFGDLPDTGAGSGPGNYATTLADNGPRHPITTGLRIGANEDAEGDGQPNAAANGDDANGTPDDEDGVVVADLALTVGANADVQVTATNTTVAPAQLCGFIDFNADGDFADAGETAPAVTVPVGSNNALFTLAFGAVPPTTASASYARFRLSTGVGACSPVGLAPDGEVEDYPVTIGQRDFGDLPDTGAGSGVGNYATLLADGGASHVIVPSLLMGTAVDAEADGQPGAAANGDDTNGTPDDEDGVNPADLALQRGVAPNVRVTVTNGSGSAALLCGYIDYNGDGDFADAGEAAQATVPNGSSGAVQTLVFGSVPNSAVATSYARFRISNDAACAPAGASASGEVEDYAVNVGSGPLSLGNLVWNDRNNNGTVDAGEPGMAGVAVSLYQDADGNGTPDGAAIATTTTDPAGAYLFQNLDPGTYLVDIVPPAGYLSSSGSNLPYAATGPYEPAPDPDNDVNDDDNGTAQPGLIRSGPVTLAVGTEPVNDGDADANSNLSVDFGLLGNFDLALVKAVSAGQPGPFAVGADVSFDITVFNQGGLPAFNVVLNDNLPAGFILSPAETNWTPLSPTLVTRTLAGPLAPGTSATVTILLRIDAGAVSPLVNRAELGAADDDTDPGNTPPTDLDSTPDNDPNNDAGGAPNTPSDGATGGNGSGLPGSSDPAGDEDDADPASITLGGGSGPSLGLAKAAQILNITGGSDDYGNGGAPPSADIAYLITVRNYATQPVTNLQVTENLVTTFGAGNNWNVSSVTSPTLTTNPAFDGRGVITLLAGTDTLAAGATTTIRLVVSVRFTPGQSYSNQVTGNGLIGGVPVTDISTDGTDPAGGGVDPGMVQVPTLIRLGTQSIPVLNGLGLLLMLGGLLVLAQQGLRRRGAAQG